MCTFFGKFLYSKSTSKSAVNISSRGGDWQAEEWEDFSVAVIPNDTQSQMKDAASNDDEYDVFSDMKPVIKKAKKVSL